MEKGMEKGIEEGLLLALKSLMKSMGIGAEEAMNALLIPETNKRSYRARLGQ